MHKVCTKILHF